MTVDILIIGGGVAGTMAAETYRNGGGQGSVLVVSDETHRLYSRVLLPHALKGRVPDGNVFLKKDVFYSEKGIGTMFGRTVMLASPSHRFVLLDGGERVDFRKLVIAVGGKPRDLGIPGDHLPGVLRLQTYDDMLEIRRRLMPGSRLAVVGSGFIALEFCAAAIDKKIPAGILNRGPHLWASIFGPETAAVAEGVLKSQGIEVRHGAKAVGIEGAHDVAGVTLQSGERIDCTAVGVGIGIETPRAPFAAIGTAEGILADATLKTSHQDVWACGDCAEFEDAALGGLRHVVGNWTNAMAQGRHVGRALLGERKPFELLTQYTSLCVPGLNLIFLGETRMRPEVIRETKVFEGGKKAIETHQLNGRVIGAILVNAPESRAEIIAKIGK